MKQLFWYWWNRSKGNAKVSHWSYQFYNIIVALGLAMLMAVGRSLYDPDNVFLFLFICMAGAGACLMIGLLFMVVGSLEYIYQAIRFRRFFGFYPPSTSGGIKIMQPMVDKHLRRMAEELKVAFEKEEVALGRLKESVISGAVKSEQIDEEARTARKPSEEMKNNFYPARNAAKDVGCFDTHSSFKDYIK